MWDCHMKTGSLTIELPHQSTLCPDPSIWVALIAFLYQAFVWSIGLEMPFFPTAQLWASNFSIFIGTFVSDGQVEVV